MRAKLRGNGGETLAETLIALLIASVAILMLTGMLTTSADLIHRSSESFSAYYAANNGLAAYDKNAEGVTVSTDTDNPTISLVDENSKTVQLVPGSSSTAIKLFINSKAPSGTPVIAYETSTTSP